MGDVFASAIMTAAIGGGVWGFLSLISGRPDRGDTFAYGMGCFAGAFVTAYSALPSVQP